MTGRHRKADGPVRWPISNPKTRSGKSRHAVTDPSDSAAVEHIEAAKKELKKLIEEEGKDE